MKRFLYVVMISICFLLRTSSVYATATDVNIVPSSPPAAPIGVTVTAITDTTAQVSWPAVTSALQYTVYLNGQAYSGSNSPQASLTGLTPHANYSVYVIANNTGGDSPQSSTVNFTTLSPIPIAPSTPTVTTTSTNAKLIWQPLAANYNTSKYTVYLDGQASATVTPLTGMQTATLNNLVAGNHTVTISATNDNREGPQSKPVTFTISTIPAPIGVQVYNKSSDTIWLCWQPVLGVSSYKLMVNGLEVGQSYQPSYAFQALNPDTIYQISVVAVMPNGEQSQGANISDQTEPLAPSMTVNSLNNKVFSHVSDLQMYFEILFAVMAAFLLSDTLKLSLRR